MNILILDVLSLRCLKNIQVATSSLQVKKEGIWFKGESETDFWIICIEVINEYVKMDNIFKKKSIESEKRIRTRIECWENHLFKEWEEKEEQMKYWLENYQKMTKIKQRR